MMVEGAAATEALAIAAAGLIRKHLEGIRSRPACVTDCSAPCSTLREEHSLAGLLHDPSPPEEAHPDPAGLISEVLGMGSRLGVDPSHPGYLAYVGSGGLPEMGIAQQVFSAMQRFTGCFFASPCTWAWERNTMLWLCKEVCGWTGDDVGGITTPGGSTSLQSAVFLARRARLPDDTAIIKGTVYCSDQVHYALRKACMLVGVPRANLRVLPTSAEHGYQLPLGLLREQIAEDRAAGFVPFLVVGSSGTTNTGAVDDLRGLREVCDAEGGLWLHADGAYGGAFALTLPDLRTALSHCDSVTVDGHKAFFLSFGVAFLLCRRQTDLFEAHSLTCDIGSESGRAYMPVTSSEDCFSPCDISGELSKPPRALWLWFCVRLFGIGAWRRTLASRLALAADAHTRLSALPGLVIHSPLPLTAFTFRCKEGGNERTKALLQHINASGTVFCSPTTLDGTVCVIRCCVVCFRTSEAEIRDLERAVAQFLQQ